MRGRYEMTRRYIFSQDGVLTMLSIKAIKTNRIFSSCMTVASPNAFCSAHKRKFIKEGRAIHEAKSGLLTHCVVDRKVVCKRVSAHSRGSPMAAAERVIIISKRGGLLRLVRGLQRSHVGGQGFLCRGTDGSSWS